MGREGKGEGEGGWGGGGGGGGRGRRPEEQASKHTKTFFLLHRSMCLLGRVHASFLSVTRICFPNAHPPRPLPAPSLPPVLPSPPRLHGKAAWLIHFGVSYNTQHGAGLTPELTWRPPPGQCTLLPNTPSCMHAGQYRTSHFQSWRCISALVTD